MQAPFEPISFHRTDTAILKDEALYSCCVFMKGEKNHSIPKRSICHVLEHLFHAAPQQCICCGNHEVRDKGPHWQLQAKQSFP